MTKCPRKIIIRFGKSGCIILESFITEFSAETGERYENFCEDIWPGFEPDTSEYESRAKPVCLAPCSVSSADCACKRPVS
jgi:hypothetical protein